LHCNGKRMKTDITVFCSGLPGTITYRGTITQVAIGQIATLHCANKVMADHVVIAVS